MRIYGGGGRFKQRLKWFSVLTEIEFSRLEFSWMFELVVSVDSFDYSHIHTIRSRIVFVSPAKDQRYEVA